MEKKNKKKTRTKTSTNSFKGGKYDWSQRIRMCWIHFAPAAAWAVRARVVYTIYTVRVFVYLSACMHSCTSLFVFDDFRVKAIYTKESKLRSKQTRTRTYIHKRQIEKNRWWSPLLLHMKMDVMEFSRSRGLLRFIDLVVVLCCSACHSFVFVYSFLSLCRLFVLWHGTKTNQRCILWFRAPNR